ncbi:hypothetical protein LTR97_004997 [Elasticomyces elasticus]|uniref:Major facilitator superfamily (MFS) profile domain-containing protein n=1 Tax=Elasticomyces elasticus TaxID=574655 RepID=A0AAN7W833_9PEZI|nr:hypothetical protein LTR97_004997 [Elasticomyces elasticus]
MSEKVDHVAASDVEADQHPDKASTAPGALDDTYALYSADDVIDPEEARKVLRKIDWHILPLLCGTYLMQYLDKSSINFASVFHLQEGTHLHGQQYAWLSSIFYFGYLVAQYPAGYAMQRLPIAKFIGVTILTWGMLIITTPACKNFAGIATNRFLLGVTEAVVNPGFVLVLSSWWTQAEQPIRLVTYYCMNGVAGIIGGLLGYAVGHITTGLQQWQYVFLIFGSISIAWGVVFLLFMPDLPSSTRFLSQREKVVAVERVAANRQGVKNKTFQQYQVWQFAKDPKTWILFFMSIAAQIPNAAQGSFTSLILKGFGFTTLQTQYYQMPGNAVQIISLLLSGWISSRWPNMRCVCMIVGNVICIAAAAALVALPTDAKWGRLVSLWLCSCQSVGFALSLTLVSSNVAGYTKKQLTGAALFVGYCVGNIIGPQTFRDKEAPLYHSAYIAILVGYTAKTVLVGVLYFYMWSVNKARDRAAAADGLSSAVDEKQAIENGMHDMTELDNKGFRYVL